jgi:uncharacterized protein YqiB (DUF1249 family)
MSLAEYRAKKRYKVNLPEQLMECEVNYRRISQLLQGLKSLPVEHRRAFIIGNTHATESTITVTVVEQTKYTSVVHIVQHSPLPVRRSSSENTQDENTAEALQYSNKTRQPVYRGDVRLYHDADMAEVVKCQRYRQFKPRYEYPNLDMHQIDEKAQMNRFLGELLTHCLSHGRVAETIMPSGGHTDVLIQ